MPPRFHNFQFSLKKKNSLTRRGGDCAVKIKLGKCIFIYFFYIISVLRAFEALGKSEREEGINGTKEESEKKGGKRETRIRREEKREGREKKREGRGKKEEGIKKEEDEKTE